MVFNYMPLPSRIKWTVIKKPEFVFLFNKHPFHVLSPYLFPLLASLYITALLISQIFWWKTAYTTSLIFFFKTQMHLSAIGFAYSLIMWVFVIITESAEGNHTTEVQKGLKLGFYLFLISEVMLFFSFFWTYFWFSLNPSFSIGCMWPPLKTQEVNVYELPLFNTIILLLSGYTLTLAHRQILILNFNNNIFIKNLTNKFILLTILLGVFFLISQKIEYTYGLKYYWGTNVFWSCFFLLTGFHGIHVLVGTMLLLFNYLRISLAKNYFFERYWNHYLLINYTFYIILSFYVIKNSFLSDFFFKKNYLDFSLFNVTSKQNISFEIALYYWHFVDIVWIFLYIIVYYLTF